MLTASKYTNVYLVGVSSIWGREISFNTAVNLLKKKIRNKAIVALDTETNAASEIVAQKLLTLQLAFDDNVFFFTSDFPLETVIDILLDKKCIVVGHNIKFDYQVIKINLGRELVRVADTMLAEQLLNLGLTKPKGFYALDSLVRRYLNPYAYTSQGSLFDPTFNKKDIRRSFAAELSDAHLVYGMCDALFTLELYHILYGIVKDFDMIYVYELENEFSLVLGDMELEGMTLDSVKWLQNAKEAEIRAAELLFDLNEVALINWNSPAQVVKVLKEKGYDVSYIDKKTGELKEGANAMVLNSIKGLLISTYLEYKKQKKISSAYGEKFLGNLSRETGKLHTTYRQLLNTGRVSTQPAVQNWPRGSNFRECFIAEEGEYLVTADFSNQEARIAAEFAKEEIMIKAFNNGEDLHLKTACMIYGEDITDPKDYRRQIAKTVAFTILYEKN